MEIFGKEMNKTEIMQRIGDISQLGGVKYYEFVDGVSRGVRAINVKSPCGLDMTILPDRGMDISDFYFKSIPIGWKSSTREASPIYFESSSGEWLRTFFGGLLTTCGLVTNESPIVDKGQDLAYQLGHRISNISAENVFAKGEWENDSYVMKVEGTVREAKVFGDKLQLERKITTWADQPKVIIEDTIENIGHQNTPLLLLYHINIGFPIIDKGSRLLEAKANVIPRDEIANDGFDHFNSFSEPIRGYTEKVYFHDIEADVEGNSNIAIVNDNFNNGQGIGIWLKFNKDQLPFLAQWKQMGMGEYVCGIEPCTSKFGPRKITDKTGNLKFVKPGEKVTFNLELNVLSSVDEIKALEKFI